MDPYIEKQKQNPSSGYEIFLELREKQQMKFLEKALESRIG
jgi:hypothetical protein